MRQHRRDREHLTVGTELTVVPLDRTTTDLEGHVFFVC